MQYNGYSGISVSFNKLYIIMQNLNIFKIIFQENGKALDMPTRENENCQLLLIASESKRPSNQGAHHSADLSHTNLTSVR